MEPRRNQKLMVFCGGVIDEAPIVPREVSEWFREHVDNQEYPGERKSRNKKVQRPSITPNRYDVHQGRVWEL